MQSQINSEINSSIIYLLIAYQCLAPVSITDWGKCYKLSVKVLTNRTLFVSREIVDPDQLFSVTTTDKSNSAEVILPVKPAVNNILISFDLKGVNCNAFNTQSTLPRITQQRWVSVNQFVIIDRFPAKNKQINPQNTNPWRLNSENGISQIGKLLSFYPFSTLSSTLSTIQPCFLDRNA